MSESKSITLTPNATALTIAGSDPSGGAGLQADLKTFQQLGVYGMSVVTLLTVQNTQRVSRVHVLEPDLIIEQLNAVVEDIYPQAIKTGALGNAKVVAALGERLVDLAMPKIIDPVLVSKHGDSLADDDVVAAIKEHLLPQAYVVTPNRFEAERLTGLTLDSEERVAEAIYRLQECGAQHVLLKLGEVDGQSQHVMNYEDGNICFIIPRIAEAKNTHGTGCILSAALTAKLALGEQDLRAAVNYAIEQVYQAIYCNTELGQGTHPAEIRAIGVD